MAARPDGLVGVRPAVEPFPLCHSERGRKAERGIPFVLHEKVSSGSE